MTYDNYCTYTVTSSDTSTFVFLTYPLLKARTHRPILSGWAAESAVESADYATDSCVSTGILWSSADSP